MQFYPALGNLGFSVNEKNLEELLKSKARGKEIISLYKSKNKVDRAKLASLIIDCELEEDPDKR